MPHLRHRTENFAEEQALGVGENLSKILEFIQVNLPYNLQRDRSHDCAECDVLSSYDTKDMTKVLTDIMNLRAHGLASCTALQLAL